MGNVLTIRIQPNAGIGMRVVVKHPGAKLELDTVDMKYTYKEEFEERGDASYEKLLLDIFSGDQMLFNRSDELENSWKLISQIMEGWKKQNDSKKFVFPTYKIGTWGPQEANILIEKDGKKWI
jgi:glucose-6-phosphate 1-dehydrogenase